jgi:hypothetical protein
MNENGQMADGAAAFPHGRQRMNLRSFFAISKVFAV